MAEVILPGLVGTSDFSSNDFPENWRTTLLRLKPDAKATLTMLMGLAKSEDLDSPIWHWGEKGIRTMVFTSNAASSAATTLVFQGTTPVKPLRSGHVLKNTRSGEVVWVSANPTSPYTDITVIRGSNVGSTSAAVNLNDKWILVSTRHAQGATPPQGHYRTPDWQENYTQIFRNVIEVTRTAAKTSLRYAKNGPTKDMLRDALEEHMTDIESAGIWGVPYKGTGDNGKPEYTTGGMFNYVTTNAIDFGGSFDVLEFLDALRLSMRYGSKTKLLLLGDQGLLTLMNFVLENSSFNIDSSTTMWGMNVLKILSPFGTLMVKQHELLTESEEYSDYGLVIDTKNVRWRPLRDSDTHIRKDVVKDGRDGMVSEYLAEGGWEWDLEQTHAIWENFSGFSA
jgi:hypothetical protein